MGFISLAQCGLLHRYFLVQSYKREVYHPCFCSSATRIVVRTMTAPSRSFYHWLYFIKRDWRKMQINVLENKRAKRIKTLKRIGNIYIRTWPCICKHCKKYSKMQNILLHTLGGECINLCSCIEILTYACLTPGHLLLWYYLFLLGLLRLPMFYFFFFPHHSAFAKASISRVSSLWAISILILKQNAARVCVRGHGYVHLFRMYWTTQCAALSLIWRFML